MRLLRTAQQDPDNDQIVHNFSLLLFSVAVPYGKASPSVLHSFYRFFSIRHCFISKGCRKFRKDTLHEYNKEHTVGSCHRCFPSIGRAIVETLAGQLQPCPDLSRPLPELSGLANSLWKKNTGYCTAQIATHRIPLPWINYLPWIIWTFWSIMPESPTSVCSRI